MAVVNIVPAIVKPVDVIALLNLEPLDPTFLNEIEHWQQNLVSSNNWDHDKRRRLFKSLDISKPSELERRIIATRLRQHVDEWLRTGWTKDGRECLAHRSLIKAPLAMKALQDYTSQQHLNLRFIGSPPAFVVEDVLSRDDSGTSKMSEFAEAIRLAFREVPRLFFGLVTSDWGPRLCKCRYSRCSLYFIHPKPRMWYKHGTFCGDHQMAWTASRHMKDTRTSIHSALVDIAAHELSKRHIDSPRWQDDKSSKVQLAQDISTRIRKSRSAALRHAPMVVQLTWVTRNRREIEKRRRALGSRALRELGRRTEEHGMPQYEPEITSRLARKPISQAINAIEH
jgi:hypothetical protein